MKKLLYLVLAPVLCLAVHAQDEYNSVEPPPGYIIRPAGNKKSVAEITDADILLVQTSLPWNSYSNTIVLDELGYKYNIADITNLSTINLFDYPVILIVNDQTQAFYDQYAAEKEQFENYVSNGGSLLFFAASDGWARGTLQAKLPGDVEVVTPHYQYYNYLVDLEHPIVTGILSEYNPLLDADLYNNYCSHGYFSSLPEDAVVIFKEANGYPTLIEYRFGKGKVVASTQTWEHAYNYSKRAFAVKALDDVFLYMFSEGYNPGLSGIEVELYLEDANSGIQVNKIEGIPVDIAIKIKNNSEETISEALLDLIPDNEEFFDNFQIFERTKKSDLSLQELAGGISDLPVKMLQPGESVEILYRFNIKDNIIPDRGIGIDVLDIGFQAALKVGDFPIRSNEGSMRLWERLGVVIVTNRDLLYKNYDESEVNGLLSKVYEISEFGNEYPAIVFNIERYSELAKKWDQNVDYTKDVTLVNEVALDIDHKLEGWYKDLSYNLLPLPVGHAPGYLLIIGGDEIIPFYRIQNSDYVDDEQEYAGTMSEGGPINKAYKANYFMTDNVYGDTDNSITQAENGKIDWAVGRIIGHSAGTMRDLLENGYKGPEKLESSLFSTLGPLNAMDAGDAMAALKKSGSNILGEENPDLIGNDDWTKTEFLSELRKEFQVMSYMAHAGTWVLSLNNNKTTKSVTTTELKKNDLNNFKENNPFVSLMGCHTGVITKENFASELPEANDCLPYKMVDLGVSGLVATTGFAYYNSLPGVSWWGERLMNLFYEYAFGKRTTSAPLGMALLAAKQELDPALVIRGGKNKKTILEFIYYGVPWTRMETSSNLKSEPLAVPYNELDPDTISFEVNEYSFTAVEEFEILEIPGSEYISEESRPMVPYLSKTYLIPKGTSISRLTYTTKDSINLGSHDLAQVKSGNMQEDVTYNSDYDFESYPDIQFSHKLIEYPDYDKLIVNYIPVKINGTDKEIMLYTGAEIAVELEFEQTVFVKNFTPEKKTYGLGDTIYFNVEIINLGDSLKNLKLDVSLQEKLSLPLDTSLESKSSLKLMIPIANVDSVGYYEALLTIRNKEDEIVGGSLTNLNIIDGRLIDFEFPDTIYRNMISDIKVNFANYKEETIISNSRVSIYKKDENVLNLVKQVREIEKNESVEFSWDWKTIELEPGNYVAKAIVETEDGSFGPTEKHFYVEKSLVINSMWPQQYEIHLCSIPDLALEIQMRISHQPKYQWFRDDVLMADYTDSVLIIQDFALEHEGAYNVMVYNEIDTVMSESVHVLKEYIHQSTQELSICEGESIFVNGIERSAAGYYKDTLQSFTGCDSIIQTNLNVNLAYMDEIDVAICAGDTFFVQGAYRAEAGLYHDTLHRVTGCDSVIITRLAVNDPPEIDLGPDMTLYRDERLLITPGPGYQNYQWSTGSGDASIVIEGLEPGDYEYFVLVTDMNYCSGSDTIELKIMVQTTLGPDLNSAEILIYPNPAGDLLFLSTNTDIQTEMHVIVVDLSGRVMLSNEFPEFLSNTELELDLSSLGSGTYFIKLNDAKSIRIEKIIKR